ncbi:MAG: hypothetical protein HYY01_11025 [Chloroflexi bacterium]|nr:hypothetical protein [Chloroflexota bacterium]
MKGSDNKSRFTLDMAPELRMRLKIAAARRGITMRQYCLGAIQHQLDREEVGVFASGAFNREAIDNARSLRDSVFGDRRLADDSAELIRQVRTVSPPGRGNQRHAPPSSDGASIAN